MNHRQRIIVAITCCVLALRLIFPPTSQPEGFPEIIYQCDVRRIIWQAFAVHAAIICLLSVSAYLMAGQSSKV